MTKRLRVHEKFRWRGWEFRLSLATSTDAEWHMQHGVVQIRLLYRKRDAKLPEEWTAILKVREFSQFPGVGKNPDEALAAAEQNFRDALIVGMRVAKELRAGKSPETTAGDPLQQFAQQKLYDAIRELKENPPETEG